MQIPWKIQKFLQLVVGEDLIHNRREFRPNFHSLRPPLSVPQDRNFFVASKDVIHLVSKLKMDHQDCQKQLIMWADEATKKGLMAYDNQTEPLGKKFQWEELKKGNNKDILHLVRPHRFSFAALLAQAALFEPDYLLPLDYMLKSWMKYADKTIYCWPYVSNLVVIYRLINLSWVRLFVMGGDGDELMKQRVLENTYFILQADVKFLQDRLGTSHPNNHLLADYFGGWFISFLYGELCSSSYENDYEELFISEVKRQFYDDGGHFEHSMHYHELCCQMFSMYLLLKKKHMIKIPEDVWMLGEKILSFQIKLAGSSCKVWSIGDTTEDSLMALDPEEGWSIVAHRQVYRYLYDANLSGLAIENKNILSGFWLLGGAVANKMTPDSDNESVLVRREENRVNYFETSGLILHFDPETGVETLFRAGVKSNTEYSAGHSHGDLLALYLRVEGIGFCVPTGTYSYRYSATDENCFRESSVSGEYSNRVVLEGQAVLGSMQGDFPNDDNGTRVLSNFLGNADFSIYSGTIKSANQYNLLSRHVLHILGSVTVVLDILPVEPEQRAKVNWFLSPQCEVKIISLRNIEVSQAGKTINFIASEQLRKLTVFDRTPYSPSYGSLKLTHRLSGDVDVAAKFVATLIIPDKIPSSEEEPSVEVEKSGDHFVITVIMANQRKILVYSPTAARFKGNSKLPNFEGSLLCHVYQGGELMKCQTLNCKSIEQINLPIKK